MPNITFVKKILANGELCKKCQEVSERLQQEGLMGIIDQIVIADERDTDSQGIVLAKQHNVSRAPFFLVEEDDDSVTVYDIYFKFKKRFSNQQSNLWALLYY